MAVYFVLLVLAAWGVVLLRRQRAPLLVLLAPFVVVCVSSAVGFGLPRFRQAAEIPIVVLAAVAVSGLLARRSQARTSNGAATRIMSGSSGTR